MYNIGIIGYGRMAVWHAKYIDSYPKTRVKGIFDIDPDRNKHAEDRGYVVYTSIDAMFADIEIDAVIIATTNDVHKELSIAAMAAGKHVICEKPVALNSAELKEITDASQKYNRVFTINQNRRTNRDFTLMRQIVEDGLIGDVYIIESRVQSSLGVPNGWRTIKELGGGMVLDWGVHLIDQIMYMLDDKVTSVYCNMLSVEHPEVDDNFRLAMMFESGLTAIIEVSTNNYIKLPRWYVLGKNGTLKINDWESDGQIIRKAPHNKEGTEELVISQSIEPFDDLIVVYEQFISAIEGSGSLTITAAQAMRVMKVMDAALLSHETGNAIKVDV